MAKLLYDLQISSVCLSVRPSVQNNLRKVDICSKRTVFFFLSFLFGLLTVFYIWVWWGDVEVIYFPYVFETARLEIEPVLSHTEKSNITSITFHFLRIKMKNRGVYSTQDSCFPLLQFLKFFPPLSFFFQQGRKQKGKIFSEFSQFS